MVRAMKQHTACFSGHRPEKLLVPWDESHPSILTLIDQLEESILRAACRQYTNFITGMARGVDILAGEAVLRLKEQYPQLQLTAAIPYKAQSFSWPDGWKQRYNSLLLRCDSSVVLSEYYYNGCLPARNSYMLSQSSLLICVSSGERGGTKQTLEQARRMGIGVDLIDFSRFQPPR